MDPVVFNKCFGWLHTASGSRGVVMCSPFGFEELGTRRSWRNFAEQIAQQGRPTLRFDYDGINDSLGTENDSDRIKIWISNIKQAIIFLKKTCGVSQIALVGLRLGATLAALAATECDIDELVLMAPIVIGRGYVRELRLVADAWWAAASPMSRKEHNTDYVDVIGNRIYKPTLDDFNKIDLRKITTKLAKRILILDPGLKQDIAQLVDKWTPQYDDLQCETFAGLEDFLQDSVLSRPPECAFNTVRKWLGDGGSPTNLIQKALPKAQFACQDFRETAIKFGPNNALFGIITEPIDPSGLYPSVLLLNTGPNLHVGNGRLSVTLARYLSLLGVTSLRFDLSGLGESESIPDRPSSLYSLEAIEDVRHAVSMLNAKPCSKGTVVIGLCSGAFLAFHSAVVNDQIVGAILVNLQRFIWDEGTSLQIAGKRAKKSTRFYLRAALRHKTWLRVLKGEGDVLMTLLTLSSRPLKRMFNKNSQTTVSRTNVIRLLTKTLSDKGKYVRFWYSEDDPGLSEFETYFGRSAKTLEGIPNIDIAILPGADHSLNSFTARMQFIAMFEAYLREGFSQEIPVVTPV